MSWGVLRDACIQWPPSVLRDNSQCSSLEIVPILHKNNPSESESPQSCLTLCNPMNYSPWNSPGKNAGVGSLFLLQETSPTQGSNPGWSPTLQVDSLSAEPQGKPKNNPKSLIKPELGPTPRLSESAYLRAGPEGISQGLCTVHSLPCCAVSCSVVSDSLPPHGL